MMKKFISPLIAITLLGLLTGTIATYAKTIIIEGDIVGVEQTFGAPTNKTRYERSLLPETDSAYYLGSSTLAWLQTTSDSFCLSGDSCISSWASASSPLTTKGDLFTYSSVDARLPVGADTYVLTADSSEATGLKWAVPGASSMVYPDAGIALSTGSAWDTSITDNSANWNTAYGWGDWSGEGFLVDPMTTRGDIIIRDASNDSERLAVGTAGQVLSTDGTDVSWQTIPNASAIANGILTMGDWSTFNGKLDSADIDTYAELNTIVADQTLAYGGGAFHDGFSDFVANEHIDWTLASQGTIHATNYVDNNTTYTGGDGLTLTGTDFDVDTTQNITTLSNLTSNGFVVTSGGNGTLGIDTNTYLTGNQSITLSGDISGTGATSITTTIGANKILESMLKSVNSPTDEYVLTYETTTGDFEWEADQNTTYTGGTNLTLAGTTFNVDDAFLLNNGDTGTGVYNFGGATSFEIVNGTNPTVDTQGECALDTTDNQFLVANSAGTARVIRTEELIGSVTIASTSLFFTNIDLPIPPEKDGYTVSKLSCYVAGGTSVVVTMTDGTNAMDSLTCGTTITNDDGSIANSAVTAGELMKLDPGTVTGAVNFVSFSWYGYYTRE